MKLLISSCSVYVIPSVDTKIFCKKCGLIASYNDKLHIHYCRVCDNRVSFDNVKIPYACKLMFQELITMNVAPRIIT